MGKRVAVVGGGNSAIDSARVAIRKGAEVHLIYRRERNDMPAMAEEVKAAEEEGVQFHFLTNPVKITAKGNAKSLVLTKMDLGDYDRSGRKVAKPIAGSEFEIEVDTVIEAIGQKPDTSFIKNDGVEVNNNVIVADSRTLATAHPGIFAGGDAVLGPQTVIEPSLTDNARLLPSNAIYRASSLVRGCKDTATSRFRLRRLCRPMKKLKKKHA